MIEVGFGVSRRWTGAKGPVWAPHICHSSLVSGQAANVPGAWMWTVLLNPDLYSYSPTLSVEICLYLSGPSVSSRLTVFSVGSTYHGPQRRVGWGGWDAGAPNGGQSLGSRMLESQKSDKA